MQETSGAPRRDRAHWRDARLALRERRAQGRRAGRNVRRDLAPTGTAGEPVTLALPPFVLGSYLARRLLFLAELERHRGNADESCPYSAIAKAEALARDQHRSAARGSWVRRENESRSGRLQRAR